VNPDHPPTVPASLRIRAAVSRTRNGQPDRVLLPAIKSSNRASGLGTVPGKLRRRKNLSTFVHCPPTCTASRLLRPVSRRALQAARGHLGREFLEGDPVLKELADNVLLSSSAT
jgi:hypothetical protein